MKLIIILFLSLNFASAEDLQDYSYQFDAQKLEASNNTFKFTRSFVDYYYGLIFHNTDKLNLAHQASSFSGWCVGDAHPENFGILIQKNNSPLFSMNDMDDFGPCPLAYDFLRLLVTSRLYAPDIEIEQIKNSYMAGLAQANLPAPQLIKELASEAMKLGESIDPKKVEGNKFIRKSGMTEVPTETYKIITNDLGNLFTHTDFQSFDLKVLDIIATSKVGGGSGGLSRFEVLCLQNNKDLVHLELKELTIPAIYPVVTTPMPTQNDRITKALTIEQGPQASPYYKVYLINGKMMLLRPKFAGNVGINLSDANLEENKAIINFEAFILGHIHSSSADPKFLSELKNLTQTDLESDVTLFTKFLNKKFNQLKN